MLGRARPPQCGHDGNGPAARIDSGSTVTSNVHSQISSVHGSTHWAWWIEPWTSATSVKPAFWNCPSTLDVKTRAPHERRIEKPSCGTVARYRASRWP